MIYIQQGVVNFETANLSSTLYLIKELHTRWHMATALREAVAKTKKKQKTKNKKKQKTIR